jgi:hypothetical protein
MALAVVVVLVVNQEKTHKVLEMLQQFLILQLLMVVMAAAVLDTHLLEME